jgi:hypothetical protein
MESVEKVAEVVLYEGYLLYPYTRSAMKNQQRWTFGGVYPRRWSEANADDPWIMQTQCLVEGDETTRLEGKVRFLQVVDRDVAERVAGALRPVEELHMGEHVYRAWEEAIEREVLLGGSTDPLRIAELVDSARSFEIEVPEGSEEEPLVDSRGEQVGALIRRWRSIRGRVDVSAEPVEDVEGAPTKRCPYKVTVRIVNESPLTPQPPLPPRERGLGERGHILRQTLVSTHTILRVQGGEFVSLLEPPPEYEKAAAACENIKTWPVLAGEPGDRHVLLSSPIILYDYPQVSPESPGNFFDTTEIDELLALSVMTLTDDEKQEMRETDPRAREILERTEALSPEQLLKLHGAIRGLRPLEQEES